MEIKDFWNRFLIDNNFNSSVSYIDVFSFGNNEDMAQSLLLLVLKGKKRATSSSLLALEKESIPIPTIGDYSIITDFSGNPQCVIQTKNVLIMPFSEMTYEICKREGEDDNLESWRESHILFFSEEGKELGYTFSEGIMICFEDFEVVYKLNE